MNMTISLVEFPADSAPYGAVLCVDLPLPVAAALTGKGLLQRIGLDDLARACIGMGAQGIVACPLIGGTGDALCVIATLREAGFVGTLLVIVPPLPDPQMVAQELRAACSGLALRMISMPDQVEP